MAPRSRRGAFLARFLVRFFVQGRARGRIEAVASVPAIAFESDKGRGNEQWKSAKKCLSHWFQWFGSTSGGDKRFRPRSLLRHLQIIAESSRLHCGFWATEAKSGRTKIHGARLQEAL